ncbi:atrial natriuretic peptide receptor 1-like [Gigantopelta aegis]|uniref:atrial natriuretic peptide receptor 1-like n=1 Tax=Gigantopelta aegis TaxID=1735272 RepID=UPI001B88C675|nr:atrial natriuretic peptide receptor 1-like [Gigantopelta aegis]
MVPASAALLVFGCLLLSMVSSLEINMAVILPFDNARPFSIQKIRPAIEMARRRLERDQVLSESTTIVFHYEDSRCDIAHGLNKAIKLHIGIEMDVFLGPVCDFAVYPVARQCTFWNLPIISGGAMAGDFTVMRKSIFFTLTRIGPANFHSLSNLLYLILSRFKWKRLKLLYERARNIQYVVCYITPYLVMMSLQAKGTSIQMDYFRLNDNQDYAEMFSKEISTYSVPAALLLFSCVLLPIVSTLHIHMSVIVPFDDASPFNVRKIRPAIEVAKQTLERDQILSESATIVFHYGDSQCHHTYSMNEAIKLHMRHQVDVFLGPVCDIAAAWIAIQFMVLCASPDTVREIMIKAHELNFDNGEYVFLNIDLFSSENALVRLWH